ncbi:MAG: hypothetical protein GEU81_04970 [Nitriliruptorales bacterium]|nr:hypothetical protein [Nitriliruptorales bacterium]
MSQEEHWWACLAQGGLTVEGLRAAADRSGWPIYDGLRDPAGAEELATELAERVADLQPTLVMLWEPPEDVLLGHILARELGIRAVRCFDADGLVSCAGDVGAGERVLVVADAFRDEHSLQAMVSLVAQRGSSVVGRACLVDDARLDGEWSHPQHELVVLTDADAELMR